MIKGTLHQEDISLININAPNIGAPMYIKQLLTNLKGEINNNSVIVGDLNTPLTAMDRSSRQKVNKEIVDLNEKLDEMDLVDIYRALHPNQLTTHSSQARMEHSLG